MQIVIPMSGQGSRFIRSGYNQHKALISVEGYPIIKHIISLFSKDDKFIFICDQEHIRSTNMGKVLKDICPTGTVIPIPSHKKGPAYAVLYASDLIDDRDEVIVNYCDFSMYWDYSHFLFHTRSRNAQGAVVAYRNFHPHMLRNNNYAFMSEKDQWMIQIKEKDSFSNNRFEEFASAGTYYFKYGIYVKKYFKALLDKNIHVNNEYYVSLVYNLMRQDDLNVSIYEIEHMLQWGTPEDFEDYVKWSRLFFDLSCAKLCEEIFDFVTIMPMSGFGKRFKDSGYQTPKPFIEVLGRPMYKSALFFAPCGTKNLFVARSEIKELVDECSASDNYIFIDEKTDGQASTVEIGINHLVDDTPILVVSCDNGLLFSIKKLKNLINDKSIDAICFTHKNHTHSAFNPNMYGWVRIVDQKVVKVSVKSVIDENFKSDSILTGCFWFKSAKMFKHHLKSILDRNERINSEFYVDSVIKEFVQSEKVVYAVEADHFISWGTPEELKTFEYWQSYFDKKSTHPYKINKDPFFNFNKVPEYKKKFTSFLMEKNKLD